MSETYTLNVDILPEETVEDQDTEELAEDDLTLEELASIQKEPLESISLEDLEAKLQEAIANEDYENASRIRDEIDRRKSQ